MRLSSFILFPVLCLLFSGCTDYDPPYFYETVSMTLSNAYNNGEIPTEAGDSVPKNAYVIQLNLTMEPREHEGADSYESDFRNEDHVTSFSITSSDTFNGIAPNLSLNHLFKIKERYSDYELTDYYGSIFSGDKPAIGVGETVPSSWISSNYLALKITPNEGGHQTFYVSGTLSDGRVLSDSITVKLY